MQFFTINFTFYICKLQIKVVRIFSSVLQGLRFIFAHAKVLIYFNTFHYITAGAYLEGGDGRGGGLPCPFSKIAKKCPNFGKKCPDFGHLWVRFLI